MTGEAPNKCVSMSDCPAVIDDGGETVTVIGTHVTEADIPELAGRIGPGEAAIVVPAEVIHEWLAKARRP